MEFIRFKRDGGPVTVKIMIKAPSGKVLWKYLYTADDKKFMGGFLDSSDPGNTPAPDSDGFVVYTHALGVPEELELDTNTWEIKLVNISDDQQAVDLKLKWDQDDTTIEDWEKPNININPDSGDKILGSALLMGKME